MGREATRAVSGGRPSVAEALRAHASVICLQHPSHPPHSMAEQVSLNKKAFELSLEVPQGSCLLFVIVFLDQTFIELIEPARI